MCVVTPSARQAGGCGPRAPYRSRTEDQDPFRNAIRHSHLPSGSAQFSIPPPSAQPSPSGDFVMAMQDVVVKEMKLQDLKVKTPTELLSFAEETGVENASA